MSDTEHVLSKRGLAILRKHGAVVLAPVRTIHEREGDRLLGVRVFGGRPEHPFGLLGFENGDRVQRMAGEVVTSTDLAAQLTRALEKTPRVVVELSRRGNPLELVLCVE